MVRRITYGKDGKPRITQIVRIKKREIIPESVRGSTLLGGPFLLGGAMARINADDWEVAIKE